MGKLGWEIHQGTIMCRWTQEVILFGLIVLGVSIVLPKLTLMYVFVIFIFYFNNLIFFKYFFALIIQCNADTFIIL